MTNYINNIINDIYMLIISYICQEEDGLVSLRMLSLTCKYTFHKNKDIAHNLLKQLHDTSKFFGDVHTRRFWTNTMKWTYSISCCKNLDILKYVLDSVEKYYKNDLCAFAAANGNLITLKYFYELKLPWGIMSPQNAAYNGHLECLVFCHENGCEWNGNTIHAATKHGHISCVKYAHEHGCEWGEKTTYFAAYNGYFDILKYAIDNGCYVHEDTCNAAAYYGDLSILQYVIEKGCSWDEEITKHAASNPRITNLEFLTYIYQNAGGWHPTTCETAASSGNLECLKYAHEHGCDWSGDGWDGVVCANAALDGHLSCLIYAHAHGCDWDEDTCTSAAIGDHLPCLEYAHTNGCPWDWKVVYHATMQGHKNCLRYAVEHKCPWNEEFTSEILNGDPACVSYLIDNKYLNVSQ
jgi:hypothetical protein